jgi:hypothetical protein
MEEIKLHEIKEVLNELDPSLEKDPKQGKAHLLVGDVNSPVSFIYSSRDKINIKEDIESIVKDMLEAQTLITRSRAAQHVVNLDRLQEPEKKEAARRVETDVELLRAEMETMKQLVSQVQDRVPTLDGSQIQASLQAVEERINSRIQSISQASRTLSAPIEMPPEEDIKVRLVTVGTIDRLSEAMQEESKWGTWGGVFLGALLGIFINIVTGGTLDMSGGILLIVLTLIAGLCGYTSWDYGQRGKVLKKKLLKTDENEDKGPKVEAIPSTGKDDAKKHSLSKS